MSMPSRLSNYLLRRGIHYDVMSHLHSHSSAETARTAHVPAHRLAKSVVLEDDQGCGMVVVPADARVNVGALESLGGPRAATTIVRGTGINPEDYHAAGSPILGSNFSRIHSIPFSSHHDMISSRAKPESARIQISTSGQRDRICSTIGPSSSTEPALPSMFERRSRAESRKSPQKT